ncbi:MAG TPA: CrcB family protein [Solirubrobacterales bacterium]|nr:CrcB family protein [Solirubrobacterales bacterium]
MTISRFDPRRLAAIYLGGVVGALARVGLAQAFPHGVGSWPWPTFAANLFGALLLGWLVEAMAHHPPESPRFALLTTGLCGTLTTFATMQLELFEQLEAGSRGLALGYAAATLIGGLACVRLGMSLGRRRAVP